MQMPSTQSCLAPALGKHSAVIIAYTAVCMYSNRIIPETQDIPEVEQHSSTNQVIPKLRNLHLTEIQIDISADNRSLQGS